MIPEIGYDSWFTIGSETNEDPTISSVGMSDAFTEFNNGNGFILGEGAVGGSWYITPGSNPILHWLAMTAWCCWGSSPLRTTRW